MQFGRAPQPGQREAIPHAASGRRPPGRCEPGRPSYSVIGRRGTVRRGVAVGTAMSRAVCPQCGRKVGPRHFACCSGAVGGRVGGKATGASKRRGDSAHYRAMVARRKDRDGQND